MRDVNVDLSERPMNLTLRVTHANGTTLAETSGCDNLHLLYDAEYVEGDCLTLECDAAGTYLVLQLDDTVAPAFVYLRGNSYTFRIPFGDGRVAYSPRAFTMDSHLLSVRYATDEEIAVRKNLALNPWDCHGNAALFPHASANVETRNESTFAARNAIDGITVSSGHGKWPFSSWGINQDPQAVFRLEFGRKVVIDEVILYFRSDFPHDAWWEQVTLRFSDDSTIVVDTKKTADGQSIKFTPKEVEWVQFQELKKALDPSPFPALRQIVVMGRG